MFCTIFKDLKLNYLHQIFFFKKLWKNSLILCNSLSFSTKVQEQGVQMTNGQPCRWTAQWCHILRSSASPSLQSCRLISLIPFQALQKNSHQYPTEILFEILWLRSIKKKSIKKISFSLSPSQELHNLVT